MNLVLFLMRQQRKVALRSFLLWARDQIAALQLRDRLAFLDPHHVARLELVVLVVRVIVLGTADRLLLDRMGGGAVRRARPRPEGYVSAYRAPYFFFARACAAMVLMRAISRRASRSREVFSSCPVARWKRKMKRSFFRLRTASSLCSSLIARMSSTFIGAMTLLRN